MNDESDLTASLRALASEALRRQRQGAHLSLEQLTAYHAGELTPPAEEEVQDHLAVCRHCTGLLLDLPAFLETPAGDLESAGGGQDASWHEIHERLPGPPGLPTNAKRPRESTPAWQSSSTSAGWRARRRTLLRLAAAALFVLAVAPLWIIARRPATPVLPPATMDLSSTEVRRGTTPLPPPPPATIHAAAASTTLILRLVRDQPNLRFVLELRGARSGTGAAAAPVMLPVTKIIDSHTLLLVLDRHQLAPGRYRLRVLDAERPSAELLGDFELEVVEP